MCIEFVMLGHCGEIVICFIIAFDCRMTGTPCTLFVWTLNLFDMYILLSGHHDGLILCVCFQLLLSVSGQAIISEDFFENGYN